MDFDFDVGFNNIEYKVEEEIINILKNKFDKIDLILEILNSRENKSIIDEINNGYNILFSSNGLYNMYIIRMEEIKNFNLVQEYVSGILVNRRTFQLPFEQCPFNTVDLKCINQLIEKYELILFRASLHSNYNIIIYSKSQKLIDTLRGKILKLDNSKFNVENISDLQDCKNFLLV